MKVSEWFPYVTGSILIFGGSGMIYLQLLLRPGDQQFELEMAPRTAEIKTIQDRTRDTENRTAEIVLETDWES